MSAIVPATSALWRKLPIEVFLPQYKLVTETLVGEVHERGAADLHLDGEP